MKITIDKAVLESALDALVIAYSDKLYDGHSATAASGFEDDIAAIKALAQPAAQPTEPAYTEALSLATALFKKHFAHEEHYASGRIVWAPCDTTAGVISQIDNMVSGLIQPAVQQEPADMFWNSDDPDEPHDSIGGFLNDRICGGSLEVGQVFTIWRAKKLPSVEIKVTAIDDEECEAEYEIVEAAHKIGGAE